MAGADHLFPAAGYAGSVDKTGARPQAGRGASSAARRPPLQHFRRERQLDRPGQCDWGLRRMILHYAHLCAVAGGVDAFLIGTEMRGADHDPLGASTYPAVQAFRDLAADVRASSGPGTKISYAADWSEYFGHQPGDGSGDVYFHLDPLWADPEYRFHRHRQLHAALGLARRVRARRCLARLARHP